MNVPLQLVMGISPAHRNQYLFSDHYLDNLLPQDPRWESALPQAEAFLTWLQGLYAREQHQLPNYNETQLEEHWFKPILTQLGHVFEGQAGVPGLNHGVKWPDYVFFPDEATRQAAVGAQNTEEYAADALAVGEVKHWDVPLSKKQKGGEASFEAQNPSWQIDYYLRATGLEWGILSNGRRWRLVHKDSSQRLSIYYEVDLVELLSRGDAAVMRYFTLFFHQAAFRPDAQGRVFLADVLAESHAYAVALEEDVEANVYQALGRLMQGFLDLPANGLGTEDLRQIYENSLYLLYRLLFILYGECRGLLPLHLTSYRDNYSLDRIKREIAEHQTPPAPMTTIYWGRLKQLFQIINGDNVALNRHLGVPRYNGRLFDPKLHPFLETCAVGDRALVEAVDLLSRRNIETGREFVDYRTLGVRHLGSIYEGLLEYQPRYATEPTVAIRDNRGERWVKAAETPEGARVVDRRQAGQVYLETDRGERKATGSYYTPQYIVEYIVENTLGPLVEEAVERVKARAKEAKGKAARAEAEQSLRQSSGQALVDEILDLKCLDPAMGSGHFLVEATEYLARALATDPYVETEAPVEEDLTYWKRRVVERCIYGVDKNPLAVELAKLSLWLATVAADKPLSFLDHHLQCGDSLIGARVDDLGEVPPVMLSKKALREREAQYTAGVRQANLFETRLIEKLPVVMGRILEITEVESDSYETVQAKEAVDQAVRELKAPFQAVADLWVSGYFGNEFTTGEYDEALGLIGRRKELLALPAVQRAQEMAEERRFFHWELAFPEAFYDQHGQSLHDAAGFDAVIGNPPYGASFTKLDKVYLAHSFDSFQLDFDSYVFFLEVSQDLTRLDGRSSFIVPEMWLRLETNENLRRKLLSTAAMETLWVSGKVFEDAIVYTCVPVFIRRMPTPDHLATITLSEEINSVGVEPVFGVDQTRWLDNDYARIEYLVSPRLEGLLGKITQDSLTLGELCDIAQGLTAYDKYQGQDEATIRSRAFHANHKKDKTFKKWLEGADVSRYELGWSGEWISYGPWLAAPRDPRIFVGPRLLFREVPGSHRRIQTQFTDEELYYGHSVIPCLAKSNRLDYSLLFLLCLANSHLLSFFGGIRLPNFAKAAFPKLNPSDVGDLPIRRIAFTTPADEREQLVREAKARAEETVKALMASGAVGSDSPLDRAMLSRAASPVLEFVEERLSTQPEPANVVHDLLAHLAERMIEMNRQKRAAVEAFWLDLEGVVEVAAFDTLRKKGKQEHTLWKNATACRPFVSEGSRSTRHLDESLGWSEDAFKAFVKMLVGKVQGLSDLVGVYRAHSPTYRDLVARIEATDWLIDQIVYKLYGLRGEEIAIVEGREE
jgi:hypothetical protein